MNCNGFRWMRERERESDTDGHVETTILKLAILLTESARLAAAVSQAVAAGGFVERVLLPHFGAVEARVATRAPRHARYQRV